MAAMLFSRVTLTFLLITCLYQHRDVMATVVELTSSLPSIIPKMTPNVTLRCDIKDILLPQSGGLVGRSLPEDIHPVERRDKAQSPNAMQFILSVVMTKDGQDIASMSEHVPARLLGNLTSNGKVTGNLAGNHGYLELSLDYPTRTQTGTYRCDVTGLDSAGHSDVIKSSEDLAQGEVTLDDLVEHIHTLELDNNRKDVELQDLRDKYLVVSNENGDLKNQIDANETNRNKGMADLKNQVQTLNAEMSQVKHFESGLVTCYDSTKWTGTSDNGVVKHVEHNVTFSSKYHEMPIVHLGLERLDQYEPSDRDYVWFYVSRVDSTGFSVRCATLRSHTSNGIRQLYVRWISLPKM